MKQSLLTIALIGLSSISISSIGLFVTPLFISSTAAQGNDFVPALTSEAFTSEAIESESIHSESTQSESTSDETSVDAFILNMMAEKQIPGLSLAIVHDQKLIKVKGYGLLDREQNVKVRPNSIFPIASMSKPLTATAIMLLVEEGKIDLDAPIGTYLLQVPPAWESITVRRLLNHTAGVTENIYQGNTSALREPSGYVEAASQLPLDFQPGEAWMYSNTGYNLAAAIVEQVSGQSFESFMQARIFEPLEMNSTDTLRASYRFSNRAMGYELKRAGVEPIDINFKRVPQSMALFKGSGSVTSNVLDLARWAIALQKGQLLSAESKAEMEQFSTATVLSRGYGLGWFVGNIGNHKTVAHGGNLWGYSTAIAQFPNDELTVIVLTNLDEQDGEQIAIKIASQYIPDLLTAWNKETPAISDPNPNLSSQLLAYLQGDDAAIERTPAHQIALTSTMRGQYIENRWQDYRSDYSVEALELISQDPHPSGTRLRYRTITPDNVHLLTVVSTPDGLISSIIIDPDSADTQ
ncbi:MAG: serine hydrolase domain-containing protein [Cyanobacteria bacterium J06621_11]